MISMVTFRIAKHSIRDCDIVEIFVDDRFIATLVPGGTFGTFRVMSSHLKMFSVDDTTKAIEIPPGTHHFTFFAEPLEAEQ